MAKDRILVFIPAYNCEKQITRVLAQLEGRVSGYISEVIIVNNLSTDNTVEAAKKYLSEHSLPPCRIINNDSNYNLGGSHKTAFNYALKNRFDYVIVLHGDDQADIRDFLPVLEKRIYRKYDCILGSRFMKGSVIKGYSKLRIFGNYGFNLLFSIVLGRKITDLGSGLNMYRTEPLKSGFFYKYPDKLYFNDLMLLAYDYHKLTMKFVPITWREEDQVSNNKLVGFSVSLLKMLAQYVFHKKEFMESDMRENKIKEYTYKIIFENGVKI